MVSKSDEIIKLRRATRDIIAISSLPSIWVRYTPTQVADSIVETISTSLSLEFAFISLVGGTTPIESGYSRNGFMTKTAISDLRFNLDPWLQPGGFSMLSRQLSNPFGTGHLQVAFTPIGFNFKNGVLVTGSLRPSFPEDTESLLLNIASNQTSVTAEHKWAQEMANNLLALAEEKEAHLKEARLQAEFAKNEAMRANELKSSFLANMSHEIRTPLGVILGFAEVLKSTDLETTEKNEYLDIISRNGQALAKIIDDILDLSKVEAGKLEVESLPLLLPDICTEVVTMFSDIARGKNVALKLDTSNMPHFEILSDAVRIRQILVNLIGNSIKFTMQGSIEITGDFFKNSKDSLRVFIRVQDSGVGMSAETAQNLFSPFHQGDNTTTRKFGGTGLGLNLSRKLGRALGGSVSLVSCEIDKGCTFEFDFLAKVARYDDLFQNKERHDLKINKQPLDGFSILIADDSTENRLLIKLILNNLGAKTEFAVNGEEAVQKALAGSYDLVLMDIQMPVLDGYGALAQLQQKKFSKPVLALTAHAMREERDRTTAAGFVDHIAKPVNIKELVTSILNHIHRDK